MIDPPKIKKIKENGKTVEVEEDCGCHICKLRTFIRCDICFRYSCTNHTGGSWRKFKGQRKGSMVDICDKCGGKGL